MKSMISTTKLSQVYLIIHVLVPIIWITAYTVLWGWHSFVSELNIVWACVIFVIGLPIHELIHYICFIAFGGANKRNVTFHFNKKNLVAYVVCNQSVTARRYRVSAVVPFVTMGLFPSLYGLIFRNATIGFFGMLSILSCSGDIVLYILLTHINSISLVHRYISRVNGHIEQIGFNVDQ